MNELSLEQFTRLAEKGNVIPVFRTVMADLETPVSAFMKLAKDDPHAFLLESVEQGERLGRYSFIGVNPSHTFICRGRSIVEERDGQRKEYELTAEQDLLHPMKTFMERFKPVSVDDLPPFTGGLVGYLNYEIASQFEPVTLNNRDDFGIPDAVFYFADTVVAFDHFNRTITVIGNAFVENNVDDAYRDAHCRIEDVIRRLRSTLPEVSFGAGRTESPPVRTNIEKRQFTDSVRRCMEYIKSGDIYQVQVGIRSEVDVLSKPLDLYRALRRINPSPYTFFFRYDDMALIGGSPEILVKMTDREVTYRPIAGTRRRGRTVEEDLFLEKELIQDPKEQAEHIMLVDLGRNDVGRVCDFHTVKVTGLMYVERYSHVMHLVSNIEGVLRKDRDGYDLMRVTFPAGTVTGAPKIRSMQIIEELEETKRGPYAGAVGWFGFSGDLDFCITLRTILYNKGTAYLQASAGIVADSQEESEYQEVMNKSRAMLRAIELAECSNE